MQTPLVSIIIPIFNRENLIKETLDSILQQSYLNWECIIVDDGSTDKTIEVVRNYIKKDSRFNLFQRPLNRLKGGNAARNFGFEKSKGQLIQWFDSDDIMLSNFITEKVKYYWFDIIEWLYFFPYRKFTSYILIKMIFSMDIFTDYNDYFFVNVS